MQNENETPLNIVNAKKFSAYSTIMANINKQTDLTVRANHAMYNLYNRIVLSTYSLSLHIVTQYLCKILILFLCCRIFVYIICFIVNTAIKCMRHKSVEFHTGKHHNKHNSRNCTSKTDKLFFSYPDNWIWLFVSIYPTNIATNIVEVHDNQMSMCPLKSTQGIANINLDALIRGGRDWTNRIGTTEICTS